MKMPTLQVGLNKGIYKMPKQAGFTLMEVMVVMLIIGLMLGTVALNTPKKPDLLRAEGTSMVGRFRTLAQSSLIEQRSMGVRLSKTGYELLAFHDGVWTVSHTYTYEGDVIPTVKFSRNGSKIELDALRNNPDPVIIFDTTGLASPFTLELESGHATVIIRSSISAEISFEFKLVQ